MNLAARPGLARTAGLEGLIGGVVVAQDQFIIACGASEQGLKAMAGDFSICIGGDSEANAFIQLERWMLIAASEQATEEWLRLLCCSFLAWSLSAPGSTLTDIAA